MKHWLFILVFLPTICFAQKFEARLNVGTDFGAMNDNDFWDDNIQLIGLNASAKLFYNLKHFQLGVGVETGPETIEPYVLPQLIGNWLFPTKHIDFYSGVTAGWVWSTDYSYDAFESTGYLLALQGGIMLKTGKHFALNAEAGVRRAVLWEEVYMYSSPGFTTTMPFAYHYIQLLIGARYRF
jgi:hypothetical protein